MTPAGRARGLDLLRRHHMHHLADAIEGAPPVTGSGVIPSPAGLAACDARDPGTGVKCDLDQGHQGAHEGFISVQWADYGDDDP